VTWREYAVNGYDPKRTAAHILASQAGEMITEAAHAIRYRLTIDDLTSTFILT
jgi:pyruvate/2-oxoglutarate dehydrogenase complex dihydrolipoamide dehydrogenase (E3) component